MTQVRIPPLEGGQARVRLVYWTNQSLQVIGFEGPEWATAYENLDLTAEAVVELTPTADIATNDGSATGYLITATTTGQRGWSCCVQVPDSLTEVELVTLVGAAAIDPDDILASRLLPTGATDGQFAVYDAAAEAWLAASVAPGAGLGAGDDAALLGSGTATDGQVLTADGLGGAAWEDATVGAGAVKLDDLLAPDDNTDLNVSTSAHGLAPKAVAPAAGSLNAYGIVNGETAIANKTIFEGLLKVVVLTRAAYDALGPGRPATTFYVCRP